MDADELVSFQFVWYHIKNQKIVKRTWNEILGGLLSYKPELWLRTKADCAEACAVPTVTASVR